MASFSSNMFLTRVLQWCIIIGLLYGLSHAQLSENFYSSSCPNALSIIQSQVKSAISKEPRMGASLLRLHFHDCFIGGCDASILLDDTQSTSGEKTALPNLNSARGFEVIDEIKIQLENTCPGVVSCADILTVVARDSVAGLGGPSYTVPLGRRDSTEANKALADAAASILAGDLNSQIPAFSKQGFSKDEFVALAGGHTIGTAKCFFYKKRIHTKNNNIDPTFAKSLQEKCPNNEGGDNNTAPIDTTTPLVFDNAYYTNLLNLKGLLPSDQQLYTGKGGPTDSIVTSYSSSKDKFFHDFSKAVVKMGLLGVVTSPNGDIRTNCRKVNAAATRTEL